MHSFYYTHISVCHFVGVFIYAGTINRSPTAADGLPFRCKRISITLRTPTKWGANTPPGVGADSSRPYPNIIKYTYSHYQICTFTSSHAHFHIIKYVFPFHRTHISTLSITCFHIIKYVHSFHRIRAFALPHTHIHIIAHAYSSPISWVFSYMRAR